jgi:predicted ATPase
MQLLLRRWEQAQSGEGQGVLLSGEAGIGKSRLVQALKEQVAADQGTWIEFRCSSYYQNSALYPLIEHVQRRLHFGPGDAPQEKLKKLEQGLREYPLPLQEVVPLFALLLSPPHPTGYPPVNMSPQKQKQKIQEALVTWLLAEALAVMQKSGERASEAELYRLKGTLTLQSQVQSLKSKEKQRSVFSRPSRLLGSSRQNRWNCVP